MLPTEAPLVEAVTPDASNEKEKTSPEKAMEEALNTTCDTMGCSSDEEEEEEEEEGTNHDVDTPLPQLTPQTTNQRNSRRNSSDLKVASQTRDVRYILHKMRERRTDLGLQLWAVESLAKCQDHVDGPQQAEEVVTNIIRALKRHPYSSELQHQAILCWSELGKASSRIKDCLATPQGMEIIFSALQQYSNNDEDEEYEEVEGEKPREDERRNQPQFELYVAIFSLFVVGFDQFDHPLLVEEGAIPSILEVLQHQLEENKKEENHDHWHPSTELVLEWGIQALSELSWLCEDMTVPQVFPHLTEVVELVVQAMKQYSYNSNIQNSGGEILRHIMKNDPDSIVLVKTAGGAKALIKALQLHLEEADDVLVEGCLTLTHFLAFPDIRDQCFATVLQTMGQHPESADVQLSACAFLADASANGRNTFRFLFDTTAAVPLLMTAMEAHPDQERVQEHACRAFSTLGAWLKARSDRKKLKIVGLVVAAMKDYPQEDWLQLYACQSLEAMVASWGNDATTFLVKVGGIKCLQVTLEQFMDDPELVWPVLAIVGRLDLGGNKFARDAVLKEKNLRTLMDGIKRHGGHDKVQEFGGKVLDLLTTINSSQEIADLNRSGDCCMRCLKLSLTRESSERWQGCNCSS